MNAYLQSEPVPIMRSLLNNTHIAEFVQPFAPPADTKGRFHPPAFIVGKERSGTTLLSAILNRHSEVCVTPETNFLYRLFRYPGGPKGFERDWPDSLYDIVDRMNPTADWDKPARLVYERLGGKAVSGREAFMALGQLISERYGKLHWIEKTPNHLLCLPFIRSLFPNAPVIHIVRDGRDVAHSLTKVSFGSANYFENLWQWKQAVSCARRFQDCDANTLAIRYEDMVKEPEQIIKQVCSFLGIPFEGSMLKPDGTEKSILDMTGNHMDQASMAIDKSKLASWRRTLSPAMQRTVEMIAHDELQAWGYELTIPAAHPARRLRLHEAMLVSRHHGHLYDTVLQSIANGRVPVRLEGVATLTGPLPQQLPDIWITGELPLTYSSRAGSSSSAGIIIRLVVKLLRLRFSGTRLIWIFHPDPAQTAKWRLRRIAEWIMMRMSTLVIWDEDKFALLQERKSCIWTLAEKHLRSSSPDFAQRIQDALDLNSMSQLSGLSLLEDERREGRCE